MNTQTPFTATYVPSYAMSHPSISHPTLAGLGTINQTQQTLDAASEFNVALVPADHLGVKAPPPAYASQNYGTVNNGVFVWNFFLFQKPSSPICTYCSTCLI